MESTKLQPQDIGTNLVFPIAEIFTSPQGEGLYTGTLMTFIRLAGCTVGKPLAKVAGNPDLRVGPEGVGAFPVWQEECTTYDGRKFLCDTNFKMQMRMQINEILTTIPPDVEHVCLTGGEPLMHQYLYMLVIKLEQAGKTVHIETSGTIINEDLFSTDAWLTVSPKLGVQPRMLMAADEVKLLVDDGFDVAKLPPEILRTDAYIYIQPINNTDTIDYENVKRCLDLQLKHPEWRISLQLHKILKVR